MVTIQLLRCSEWLFEHNLHDVVLVPIWPRSLQSNSMGCYFPILSLYWHQENHRDFKRHF